MTSPNSNKSNSVDVEARDQSSVIEDALNESSAALTEVPLNAESLLAYDPTLSARARGLWIAGDWDALARIDPQSVRDAHNSGELLMLIASAYSNLGESSAAQGLAHKAIEWGCSRRFAALILTASLHNTLGRIAALRQDSKGLERNFRAAVNARPGDILSFQVRSIREMSKLGLLPQAAASLESAAWQVERTPDPLEQSKRLKQLRLEADLLKQEVSLAVRNGQVLSGSAHEADSVGLQVSESINEADLKRLSTSQIGQDIWVVKQSNFKRCGFFVEFGATDGVLLSNTFMLETYFGWEGILAEPNPVFFKDLNRNRKCIVTDACIDAQTGHKKEFIFADVYGGLREYADRDEHLDRREAYRVGREGSSIVETISLNDYLKKYNSPRDIDYISVDTEGNELEILSAFDFDYWNVRMWTVEHNYTPQRQAIRDLMAQFGYRCVEASHDDWFIR